QRGPAAGRQQFEERLAVQRMDQVDLAVAAVRRQQAPGETLRLDLLQLLPFERRKAGKQADVAAAERGAREQVAVVGVAYHRVRLGRGRRLQSEAQATQTRRLFLVAETAAAERARARIEQAQRREHRRACAC